MTKHISFLLVLLTLMNYSCNESVDKIGLITPNEIEIFSFETHNTTTLKDNNQIKRIIDYLNKGKIYSSKFSGDYLLILHYNDSLTRIIVQDNLFKYSKHNYKLDVNLKLFLDDLTGNVP
ncbi:hypothetical protein [Psychroserpens luteus]|uniref:Uncharacterized protein n=1 Tax=Psychroserpens luteus TaxID=1434066 RepID=A0ABW5ZX84_9FLAO|nr:hypothetical protein [Psychroserpens luteus]